MKKSNRLLKWSGIAGLTMMVAITAVSLWLRMQLRQREFTALQSTRTVAKAAANYHAKFGVYAPALQDLATYEEGWCQDYATEPVFTGNYYGYRFVYEAPLSLAGSRDRFFLRAVPFARENTGAREFCADQTGAIRIAKKGSSCTAESQALSNTDGLGRLRLP